MSSYANWAKEYFGMAIPARYEQTKQNVFGVELELEGIPIEWDGRSTVPYGSYVNIVKDGSLRNSGAEYVFSSGFTLDVACNVLDIIAQHWVDLDIIPSASSRCGLHVHCNVLNRSGNFIDQFVTLIAVIEPVIYKLFSTPQCDRSKTRFATPLADCIEFTRFLSKLSRSKIPTGICCAAQIANSAGYDLKYSGLNLMPLFRYGTVEFRHFSSTTDVKRIKQILIWLDSLMTFVGTFKEYSLLEYLINVNSGSAQEEFLCKMFSAFDWYEPTPEDMRSIRKNIRLVRIYTNFEYAFGDKVAVEIKPEWNVPQPRAVGGGGVDNLNFRDLLEANRFRDNEPVAQEVVVRNLPY